jgi:hypothetical protein
MLVAIGSLVTINVDFELTSKIKISKGDYAIVIGYPTEDSSSIFDYLAVCNGVEVYLFKYEIELVN